MSLTQQPVRNRKATEVEAKNQQDVLNYYDTCWLNRFADGHNPKSYAMHFGIFDDAETDNDLAKLRTNQFLADQLGMKEGGAKNVVDLGCGVGGTCLYLAKEFPESTITGVNLSATQLGFAENLIQRNEMTSRVSFLQEDYCKTSLADDHATQVFAVESMWHANEKHRLFKEAYRISSKNGVFVVIDYFQTRAATDRKEAEMLRTFNIGWGAYEDGTGPLAAYRHDFLNDLRSVGFSEAAFSSLLKNVKQGIINSDLKAKRIISQDESLSADLVRHYNACIALRDLIDIGLIDYGMIRCTK